MELIEAVINLIGKFHNNSPVNNILDLPSLLLLRWAGEWLCPGAVKKQQENRSCTSAFPCSVTHRSRGLLQPRNQRRMGSARTQHPHPPFALEALALDWTSQQMQGCGSSPEKELPDQQRRLLCCVLETGPSALLALSGCIFSQHVIFRPQFKLLPYLVYID